MNYEKAYKEALERARELVAKCTGKNKDFYIEDYSYIFPELRESEDERIRRSLVEYHRKLYERNRNDETAPFHRDALAYLEKQKESFTGSSEDERVRKALVWHLKADVDFVSNGVTKAECIAYLEKQEEQKEGIRYAQKLQKDQKPAF